MGWILSISFKFWQHDVSGSFTSNETVSIFLVIKQCVGDRLHSTMFIWDTFIAYNSLILLVSRLHLCLIIMWPCFYHLQCLLRLKEPSVLLRCRKEDIGLVESVLHSAKHEYAEKANVHHPEIVIDNVTYLPPARHHHHHGHGPFW